MRRPVARAIAAAPATRPPRRPVPQAKEADVAAVGIDRHQRLLVDEYGELDRRMQCNAPDVGRYELLKKAIKAWFNAMPPDADATIEGDVYRLHVSARERERRVKSMRGLIAVIGMDKFCEIATVPIGAIEDLIGKTKAAGLIAEARSGSRRLKSVPKREAAGKG